MITQVLSITSLVVSTITVFLLYYFINTPSDNCNHKVMDENLFKRDLLADVESSVIAQTNIVNQDGAHITFYYGGADSYKMDPKLGFVNIYENERIVASLLIKDIQLITVNKTPGGINNDQKN